MRFYLEAKYMIRDIIQGCGNTGSTQTGDFGENLILSIR